MSFDNSVQVPDAFSLLVVWLEEELHSLRNQSAELDARIQRTEQRLNTLRDPAAFKTASAPSFGTGARPLHTDGGDASATDSLAVSEFLTASRPTPATIAHEPPVVAISGPSRSIVSLRLETRTHNALIKGGVNSFAQLIAMTPEELRALPGFGAGCLTDLESALARVNVTLAQAPSVRSSSTVVSEISTASMNAATNVADSDVSQRAASSHATYEDAVALHYRFGVVRADDLARQMQSTNVVADDLLSADPRWHPADAGWFVRAEFTGSWIGRRIFEVLNGVRSIAIEPLYQSLKRIATHKFLEQGCRMPRRELLIEQLQRLRAEGVRFDIVLEIASIDAPIGERDLSGTAQAILKAFDGTYRALTGAELIARIQSAGLSDASAQLALGASPLVTKLERGIYGLVGRHAELRDIASARSRREAGKVTTDES